MPIRQFLDGERFDPETTRLLGIAIENALQALHTSGVLDAPREAIARAIIGFAKRGEFEPIGRDKNLENCVGHQTDAALF